MTIPQSRGISRRAPSRGGLATGWLAVGLSTMFSAFWAFWGSIENFHEGWYDRELWRNLLLAGVQYLPWMFVIMVAGLVAIWQRWLGVAVHLALAALALWWFRSGAGAILLAAPLGGLGLLYAFGDPHPQLWARRVLIGVPILTALISGAYPGFRVLTRPSAVDLSMRRITGNGVDLVWAPAGPGWPAHGFNWHEANRRCALLTADGLSLAPAAQRIWRLPTVEEAVRSMSYRGHNAGGVWDPVSRTARYRVMPDREAPLWNPFSQVIYWWTADEDPSHPDEAYRVVYNGIVNTVRKAAGPDYLACRCVRSP